MRISSWVVIGAGLLALGSCDDGDGGGGLLGGPGGGSCSAFTPCGGSVVGTWQVQQLCASGSAGLEIEGCPMASLTLENVMGSGSVTYNADLTTSGTVTLSGVMKASIPGNCLMGQTCAQLETELKGLVASDPTVPFSSAACTGSTTCTCMLALKPMPVNEPGTYVTNGNNLISRNAAGEEDTVEYCASATELRIRTPMSMASMDVSLNVRLTKR